MDIRFYDFFIRLNNYLIMMNVSFERLKNQETTLGKAVELLRQQLPTEMFKESFNPLLQFFEDRLKLMDEIKQINNDFMKVLQDYNESFKGTIQ